MDYISGIKEYMSKRGMTQGQFANHIGVDEHTITRWLRGKTQPRAGAMRDMVDRVLGI
ncbi:transcriptional regulator with XRE-family HTH domain [Paenibacillus harenae]|nr:transcriptional regulator with XRE-family HTH domain [Paenibacillus harenae]